MPLKRRKTFWVCKHCGMQFECGIKVKSAYALCKEHEVTCPDDPKRKCCETCKYHGKGPFPLGPLCNGTKIWGCTITKRTKAIGASCGRWRQRIKED